MGGRGEAARGEGEAEALMPIGGMTKGRNVGAFYSLRGRGGAENNINITYSNTHTYYN